MEENFHKMLYVLGGALMLSSLLFPSLRILLYLGAASLLGAVYSDTHRTYKVVVYHDITGSQIYEIVGYKINADVCVLVFPELYLVYCRQSFVTNRVSKALGTKKEDEHYVVYHGSLNELMQKFLSSQRFVVSET